MHITVERAGLHEDDLIEPRSATFFFGGRPRFSVPAGMSQSCSLHFGQRAGLPSMRLTQEWAQRRHLQIMLRGIDTLAHIIGHFVLDFK